jgi:hypothetical protein
MSVLEREREREREKVDEVKNVSSVEGSQAMVTRPSGRGMFKGG